MLTILQNITKIRGAPAVKLEVMEASLGGRLRAIRKEKKEVYTQAHLPPGCLPNWKDHDIPAWRNFAGAQESPWNTSSLELCEDLKEIWGFVYPSYPQVVDSECAIFVVVRTSILIHYFLTQ